MPRARPPASSRRPSSTTRPDVIRLFLERRRRLRQVCVSHEQFISRDRLPVLSHPRRDLSHRARGGVEGPALAAMLQQRAGGTSACRSRVATWEGTPSCHWLRRMGR
jgi:hypothetical protein